MDLNNPVIIHFPLMIPHLIILIHFITINY